MKLSIVIPVYGVEKYVADCIESCLECIGNTSNDVEIIIVDDGSKDRSIDIVRGCIARVSYAKIIKQSNQGLSMARNNGFKEVTGDYVWFVDSDDIVASGAVGAIINSLNHFGEVDVLELSYKEVDEFVDRKSLPAIVPSMDERLYCGKDVFLKGFNTPVQFHVFSRDYLKRENLHMYPGIYHEDSEFTPRTLWKAHRVARLLGVSYYYRQRRNSIMSMSNPQKGVDYIFVANRLQEFFNKQTATIEEKRIISDYIAMTYCNGLHNVIGAKGEDRKRVAKAAYEYRCVLSSLKIAIQWKYRILGMLGSLMPRHIADFYQMMMSVKR